MNNNDKRDIRCEGLLDGVAKRSSDNSNIYIQDAKKEDGELYCPECLSLVNFRRCTDKIDHYYHIARQSDMDFSPESKLHLDCKLALLKELKEKYPDGNWCDERRIDSINSIPDISGRVNDKPLAIEIQKSSIKPSEIIKRTEKYFSINLPVLWIVPLYSPLGDEPFRPRMIERFFHEIYNGKCFYWDPSQPNSICPVHYSKAFRYIEESEFYSEDGELQSFGGYDKAYKTIKKPNYGIHVNISEEFEIEKVGSKRYFDTETMLPEAYIYKPKQNPWWDALDNSITDERLEERLKQLNEKKNIKIGKYKHKSLFLMLKDAGYCNWFKNTKDLAEDYRNREIVEAIVILDNLSLESEIKQKLRGKK